MAAAYMRLGAEYGYEVMMDGRKLELEPESLAATDEVLAVHVGSAADCVEIMAGMQALVNDMIPVILGWGVKFYELAGGSTPLDWESYPLATARGFIDRAHELGILGRRDDEEAR